MKRTNSIGREDYHLPIDECNVYNVIVNYIKANGFSPTLREVSERTGYSRARLSAIVSCLRSKGIIGRRKGVPRSFSVAGMRYASREAHVG